MRILNDEGFTLVEVLAVLVIIGIVFAIATISIFGIIDRSKKDAHIINAKTLVSSADKYYVGVLIPINPEQSEYIITLKVLKEEGYIEEFIDPDTNKETYDEVNSYVLYKTDSNKYYVILKGEKRSVITQDSNIDYGPNGEIFSGELNRKNVVKNQ